MQKHIIWSLRLGFSSKEANIIQDIGLNKFIQKSISYKNTDTNNRFYKKAAATFDDHQIVLKNFYTLPDEQRRIINNAPYIRTEDLKFEWIEALYKSEFPLREKMTLFWHNHFVSTQNKVLVYYLHKQNQLFRENAFGNLKTLTKLVLKDNALLLYLDNNQNKKGKANENLSRELLELFTLGIGNYTENDIKEGARALSGLSAKESGVSYNPKTEDNTSKTYLNKTGNLKVDDMVDAIFDHPKMGYFIVEKILKYFITDNPTKAIIEKYTLFFKKEKFEIAPLLIKIFTETDIENYQGAKIKDPLVFALQSLYEFNYNTLPKDETLRFLAYQGMNIFFQPNVKGWVGGQTWLNTDKLIHRYKSIEDIIYRLNRLDTIKEKNPNVNKVSYNKNATSNIEIIKEFSDQLIYKLDDDLLDELSKILTYDFYKDKTVNINPTLLRLKETIMKTPIYQLL